MRQMCKNCGCEDYFDFNVPEEIWNAVVPAALRRRVVCLKCFDRMARERGVRYAEFIQRIFFAGEMAAFEFETVRATDNYS